MKLGILGVGKMGGAILDGVLKKGLYEKKDILLYIHSIDKLKKYKEEGYMVTNVVEDIYFQDTILLGIKPQMYQEVLGSAKRFSFRGKTVISIAPGLSISYLSTLFIDANIVRAMPNTPASIGYSVTTVCGTNLHDALRIFESIGVAYCIDEKDMDSYIPINGSMPAYVFYFVKAFLDEALDQGLDRELSKRLLIESIIASCKLLESSTLDVDTLIQNVCSKGGTTIAGLNQLIDGHVYESIRACSKSCSARSKELSK